jgi:hypothetical protein
LKLAYEASLYAGAKPKFITERQLTAGITPSGTLIVPLSRNVTDGAYNAILNFKAGGGKILALGQDCLSKTERNIDRQNMVVFDEVIPIVEAQSNIISPSVSGLQDSIAGLAGLLDCLKDPYGNTVTGVEKISKNTGGKKLVNLCNYTWNEKVISVDGNAKNLLTGEVLSGGTTTLKPFTPVLLEISELSAEMSVSVTRAGKNGLELVISNTGDVNGYISLSVKIHNGANPAERADIYKYIKSGGETRIFYGFTLPDGEYTALIEGGYSGKTVEPISVGLD